MTLPVLHSFKLAYPGVKLSILTKVPFKPLFETLDAEVLVADTKKDHRGLPGLYRLFREIKSNKGIDGVADLHHVLRSRLLCVLFRLSGIKVASIDKGRDELKRLTRKENKDLTPIANRYDRYRKVFNVLGFNFELNFRSIFHTLPALNSDITKFTGEKKQYWIGIAPFAAFEPKIYPLEKMRKVVLSLMQDSANKIFFFGGGKSEETILSEWEKEFPGSLSIPGKLSLSNELQLMSHLDVMIAMDSANMHFASICGVPVLSVWGATHPYAGFTPWGQPTSNQVQLELYCRPCSVYGNIPCYRGDHACMRQLQERLIVDKVKEIKARP